MLSETKKVPTVLFKIRKEVSGKSQEGTRTPPEICKAGTWIDQSTDDFFLQKKVIVFSLPGAFTPTCSSQQLPGFDEKFNEFNKYGIDAIYCISVNDSFVMNAWAEYQNIKNVKMIPDWKWNIY
jgi:peroxiredoxin